MTRLDTSLIDIDMREHTWRPPGVDARELVPDLGKEAVQMAKDQIEGIPPSTVLGVLIDRRRPMELVTLAGLTGTAVPQVRWTVEFLAQIGFCRTFDDDGIRLVELTRRWTTASSRWE